MSVLAQLRPKNRNSPGRIRDGLWPNILETLSDSVRRLPGFPSAVAALRALISKSSVDRS